MQWVYEEHQGRQAPPSLAHWSGEAWAAAFHKGNVGTPALRIIMQQRLHAVRVPPPLFGAYQCTSCNELCHDVPAHLLSTCPGHFLYAQDMATRFWQHAAVRRVLARGSSGALRVVDGHLLQDERSPSILGCTSGLPVMPAPWAHPLTAYGVLTQAGMWYCRRHGDSPPLLSLQELDSIMDVTINDSAFQPTGLTCRGVLDRLPTTVAGRAYETRSSATWASAACHVIDPSVVMSLEHSVVLGYAIRQVPWTTMVVAQEPAHRPPAQPRSVGTAPVCFVSALGGSWEAAMQGMARRGPADALALLLPTSMLALAEADALWPHSPIQVAPGVHLLVTHGVHISQSWYRATQRDPGDADERADRD